MNQSVAKRLRKLAKKIHNMEEGKLAPEKFILKSLKKDYKQKKPEEKEKFLNLLEIL
mgnify:CR=1 FL=1